MAVKTFGQLTRKDEHAGVAFVGGTPKKTVVDTNALRAYRFPVPVRGVSVVPLELKDEEGNPVNIQVELKDGLFVVPKTWEKAKKIKYRAAFLAAGFEETSVMPDGKKVDGSKPPVKKYTFFAGHPDNTETEKVNGKVSVEVRGKAVELDVIEGVVTTTVKGQYTALLKSGFYEAKPAEEIKEEHESGTEEDK